jgi:hypothetical protein
MRAVVGGGEGREIAEGIEEGEEEKKLFSNS